MNFSVALPPALFLLQKKQEQAYFLMSAVYQDTPQICKQSAISFVKAIFLGGHLCGICTPGQLLSNHFVTLLLKSKRNMLK